jgi:thiamine-phosphate pyrophosphorylase
MVTSAATDLVARANALAEHAHRGQQRRHGAPYISHPRAVARMLAAITDVSPAVTATALCHDVVEDTEVTVPMLRAELGDTVASGVQWLTKPSDMTPSQTDDYFARMRDAPTWVRMIKACDRLHNLSELHLQPDRARLRKSLDETTKHILPLLADVPSLLTLMQEAMHLASLCGGLTTSPARTMQPGLYAIVSATSDVDELQQRVQVLCEGGVSVVQLRQKHGSDRWRLALLRALVDVTAPFGVPVIMNDRADLARAAHASGLHVGDEDLLPTDARIALGEGELGHSTHLVATLIEASRNPSLTHVALGPIFASATKSGHADVVGIEALREACAQAALPVVAIGGFHDETRVLQAGRAGARWVAVVQALLPASHVGQALLTQARVLALAARAGTLPALPSLSAVGVL